MKDLDVLLANHAVLVAKSTASYHAMIAAQEAHRRDRAEERESAGELGEAIFARLPIEDLRTNPGRYKPVSFA